MAASPLWMLARDVIVGGSCGVPSRGLFSGLHNEVDQTARNHDFLDNLSVFQPGNHLRVGLSRRDHLLLGCRPARGLCRAACR